MKKLTAGLLAMFITHQAMAEPPKLDHVIQCEGIELFSHHLDKQVAGSLVAAGAPEDSEVLQAYLKRMAMHARNAQRLDEMAAGMVMKTAEASDQKPEDLIKHEQELLAFTMTDLTNTFSRLDDRLQQQIEMQSLLQHLSRECSQLVENQIETSAKP